MSYAEAWDRWLSRRRPEVRARLLRMNGPAGPGAGVEVRGWHPSQKRSLRYRMECLTRGEVVRRWGRGAWASIAPQAMRGRGKNKVLTMTYVIDYLKGSTVFVPLRSKISSAGV